MGDEEPACQPDTAARANHTKQINRSAILRAIAGQDRASRITVADMTGLSRATITRIVEELVRARIVNLAGSFNSSMVGRKSDILEINPAGGRIVGLHLGGWSNDVGLSDLGGNLYAHVYLPLIDDQSIDRVLPRVFDTIDELLAGDTNPAPVAGIGIATGGDIDSVRGRVRSHAQYGWADIPLRDRFEDRFGLHAAVVNTFQGVAWSEALFATDTRDGSVLFVNCGALIGAGFAPHHTIDHGMPGMAGQLGHTQFGESEEPCVCGKRGCLQASVSDGALVARALAALPDMEGDGDGETPPRTIQRLAEVAVAGHPFACELFEMRARALAPAIAVLANTLGPAVLALGLAETAYRQRECDRITELVRAHLYPGLRPRVHIRPNFSAARQGGMLSAVAAVVRDFYSPALDLRPGSSDTLIPVIGSL